MNKFVLANILKNFRWLKIRLHDSKLKHLKCPRCYSLSCIIQFTRYSQLAFCGRSCVRRELFYINTSFRICQELFSSFFKFLFDVNCAPGCSPFITQLVQDITQSSFCQALFLVLLNFLFYLRCLADSFDILAPQSHFVKHFFTIFAPIFCAFYLKTTVRQLWANPLFSTRQTAADP